MRIGTRGSALALTQARWVAERLGEDAELVTITTSGDRGVEDADKSRWVSELERALLGGEIDLAVHSAKDVPAQLPSGLELVAFPRRADPRDVICGAASLATLRTGARVGTNSMRRAAQVRAVRDDVEVVPLRGNVDTRLQKLSRGEVDALVIAHAGLQRLGRAEEVGGVLDELVPAAGQGALALEARPGAIASHLLERVSDADTAACVSAERQLVRVLGASCNTPVAAHARASAGGQLELVAWVGMPDGSAWVSDRFRGAPDRVGGVVGERLLAAGAGELLRLAARAAEPVA
jgi:hydroxymethylbilane synthase